MYLDFKNQLVLKHVATYFLEQKKNKTNECQE
jgi:hypothetical protein